MTTQVRQQAEEAAQGFDELNAIVLPEPSADLVPLPAADAPTAEEIRKRVAEIDMATPIDRVLFGLGRAGGIAADQPVDAAGREEQDVAPAGDSLREDRPAPSAASVDELDPNRKQSWWEPLFGKAKPIHNFMAKYEQVQDQIDRITENLLQHEHTLMKDIKSLDLLYEKTLDFYDELALYIAAGEEKLRRTRRGDDPRQEARCSRTGERPW